MKILFEAIQKDLFCDDCKLMCISICSVLLKKSARITTTLLSQEIHVFSYVLVKHRYFRSHPLATRARNLLRSMFEKFSEAGLFVLLFRGGLGMDAQAVKSNTNQLDTPRNINNGFFIESDLFFVLRSVIGSRTFADPANPGKMDANEVVQELEFPEKPVNDVVRRLLMFTDFTMEEFQTVIGNLSTYLDVTRPKVVDPELVQSTFAGRRMRFTVS